MSTALDYSAMLRRAKAAKKSTAAAKTTGDVSSSDNPQVDSKPPSGFQKRNANPNSLVDSYLVSPEGLERAFYVPDFVTSQEESFCLSMIYASQDSPPESSAKWVQLSHRRLKVYGGTPDAQGTLQRPLPAWIDDFLSDSALPFLASTPPLNESETAAKPDHVLLNEYSGGMGIAPHYDGPLYRERVLVLNLQSPAVMYFYHVNETGLDEAFSLVLEPRSLLIFEGKLYTELKHGIVNATEDDLSAKSPPLNARLLSAETRALLASGTPLSRGTHPRLSLTLRKIRFQAEKSESEIATNAEKEDLRRNEINFYRNVSELN